jgi:hypothetical protein
MAPDRPLPFRLTLAANRGELTPMPTEDQPDVPKAPFDEQAAVEHLERLKRELEASRVRRKEASIAFDTFVNSFHKPSGAATRAAPPSDVELRVPAPRLEAPPWPTSHGAPRKPLPKAGLVAGGVLAVAAGLLLARAWRGSPSDAPPARTSVESAASTEAPNAAAQPAATPTSDSPASHAPAELVAIRDVWVRVTVDGVRVIERELESGARIPLRGRTIVVRAGNAGAVRMTIDGEDRGPLGAEGIVLTRTYTTSSPGR